MKGIHPFFTWIHFLPLTNLISLYNCSDNKLPQSLIPGSATRPMFQFHSMNLASIFHKATLLSPWHPRHHVAALVRVCLDCHSFRARTGHMGLRWRQLLRLYWIRRETQFTPCRSYYVQYVVMRKTVAGCWRSFSDLERQDSGLEGIYWLWWFSVSDSVLYAWIILIWASSHFYCKTLNMELQRSSCMMGKEWCLLMGDLTLQDCFGSSGFGSLLSLKSSVEDNDEPNHWLCRLELR